MTVAGKFTGLMVLALLLGLAAPAARAQDATPPADDIEIAFVLHVLNAFTEVIQQGAEDAGRELGVTVSVTGVPAPNSTEQIALFEASVQQGVDGIAVVPQPGDVWETPIQEAIDAGIPVATTNVISPNSAAPVWVGQDEYTSGVTLGTELRGFLEEAGTTEGLIVVGACVPGVEDLILRYDGFASAMEGSGFELSEAQDVTGENTSNAAAWENLATANPEAVAMVGLCSLDIANLAPLKQRTGASWLIAGYDLDVPTLDAIRDGVAQVTVGQQPYLQGYLPVLALVDSIRNGTPLVEGWLQVETEVVTAENVDLVYDREANEEDEATYYREYIAANFSDLEGAITGPIPGSADDTGTPAP